MDTTVKHEMFIDEKVENIGKVCAMIGDFFNKVGWKIIIAVIIGLCILVMGFCKFFGQLFKNMFKNRS